MRLRAFIVMGCVVIGALVLLLALSTSALATGPATITSPAGAPAIQKSMQAQPGGALWHQPLAPTPIAFACSFDQLVSDDFTNGEPWAIRSIYVPSVALRSVLEAASFTWQIYADDGGLPDGTPTGLGNAPVWSLTLPPTSAMMTVTPGYFAGHLPSQVLLRLPAALVLPAGHWWLVLYPTWSNNSTSFGWPSAPAVTGYALSVMIPGFGSWRPTLQYDLAFTLEGEPAIPRPVVQAALDSVLSSSISRMMQRFYLAPVAVLRDSLNPKFWIDDRHLKASSADRVFTDHRTAVSALAGLAPRAGANRAAVEDAIAYVVTGDMLLARQAIDDATLHNGDAGLIALAEEHVAQGLALAATDPAAAVIAFANAWRDAVAAW